MSYTSTVLADSPLWFWKLDEASGTVATDSSGNGRDGIYAGTSDITYQATGPNSEVPYAITFGGTSGYAGASGSFGTTVGTGAQSWEIIFYTATSIDSSTSVRRLMCTANTDPIFAAFLGSATAALTNEVICVGEGANRRTGWTGITIASGWHHLLLTYSGTANGWTCYLDGDELVADLGATKVSANSGARGIGQTSGTNPRLGRDSGSNYQATTVAMFAVYGAELTGTQVDNHYAAYTATITGTVAVTEANDTSAASGSTVTGTVAVTEANDTLAGVGELPITGTLAVTEAADTLVASGALAIEGTLAVTESSDTSAGTGTVAGSGTVAVTEANDTLEAIGTVTITTWPDSGTGSVSVSVDQNRVYAIVGTDTTPTRVIKSASGTVTAQLVNWDQDPVNLTGYTVTFDVARAGINVASTAVTVTTAASGLVSFTFPSLAPGVYLARFTIHYNSLVWSYPVRGLEVRV